MLGAVGRARAAAGKVLGRALAEAAVGGVDAAGAADRRPAGDPAGRRAPGLRQRGRRGQLPPRGVEQQVVPAALLGGGSALDGLGPALMRGGRPRGARGKATEGRALVALIHAPAVALHREAHGSESSNIASSHYQAARVEFGPALTPRAVQSNAESSAVTFAA